MALGKTSPACCTPRRQPVPLAGSTSRADCRDTEDPVFSRMTIVVDAKQDQRLDGGEQSV